MIKNCKNFGHEYEGKQCQKCKNIAHKRWRDGHRDIVKKNSADYYAKNKETIKQNVKDWCLRNSEKLKETKSKYREKTAERFNNYRKDWRKKNPDIARRDKYARRAREKSCAGSISVGITEDLLKKQKSRCACCATTLADGNIHRDHIVPLARGGDNSDENIQLLCGKCNRSKGAKDPIEFMQSRGFLL